MTPRQWLAFGFVASMWGTTFFWYKLVLRDMPPEAVLLYRTGFGTLTLLLGAVWLRPRWRAPPAAWVAFILFGVLNLAFPQWLIIWSERTVDSGMTAVMLAATPLFTLLAAQPVLADEPITARRVVAIALGFAGVALLMSHSLRVGEAGALKGQLAQLGAALCFALTSVLARWKGAGMDPLVQAIVAAGSATVFAGVLVAGSIGLPPLPASPLSWAGVLMLGVITNGVAWVLFVGLLAAVGPTQTQMISYLVPLVAVALGVAVLGEALRPELAGGGALILAALALSHRAHAAARAAGAPRQPESGSTA